MAGPGGGGHSGGGGRGGFSGGGFSGGHHSGHHHVPMGGGWHFHRRRHVHVGGGCCGSIFSGAVTLLILAFWIFGAVFSDGYDEEKFQDFANSQYEAEFGSSSAYEDNLLITVLVNEDYYDYYYIAWVGDHIDYEINCLMGNNDTVLGQTMENSISSSSYKYSLDSDLANVMKVMTGHIQNLKLDSSFTCSERRGGIRSHVTNHANIELTESTINGALEEFTDTTGIPVVIVVEDMKDVFGRGESAVQGIAANYGGIILTAVLGVGAVVAIVAAVTFVRRRNQKLD